MVSAITSVGVPDILPDWSSNDKPSGNSGWISIEVKYPPILENVISVISVPLVSDCERV